MPHRKVVESRTYDDLPEIGRDNIAKQRSENLARLNILKNYEPVARQIARADLSEIADLIRSNTFLLQTLNSMIAPLRAIDPATGAMVNLPNTLGVANITTFLTTGNKLAFQFQKMADILSEYKNDADVKKINPTEWNSAFKRINPMLENTLGLINAGRALSPVSPTQPEARRLIRDIGYSFQSFVDMYNWIRVRLQSPDSPPAESESVKRSDTESKKDGGCFDCRFFPEDVGVERKLL